MSNARPQRRPHQLGQLTDAARTAARLAGCTCHPDVDLASGSNVHHARVAHDEWCALWRAIHHEAN